MVKYEFYGDNDILELGLDAGSAFIDLAELRKTIECFPDSGCESVPVVIDTQSVRDLFGYYGILEKCPSY